MSPQPEPARTRPETSSLPQLIGRLAQRDERALAELYDATSQWVFGLALRVLGDAAAAEEVTLDVYHQAWHRAETFDPRRGRAHSWLLTMARNRAVDRLRARAAAERQEVALDLEAHQTMDPRPDPEAHAILADRGARVRFALDELGPEQREVIELAFFEGLSHGQIARRLGQPLGTVKTRIRLGIRRLADKLVRLEDAS